MSTTGAGDAFFAGFMAKLLNKFKESLPSIKKESMSYRAAFHAFLKQQNEKPGFFQECLTFGNATAAFIVQGESAQGQHAELGHGGEVHRQSKEIESPKYLFLQDI